ncbi:unnamed protein product [Parnassius apollo]|uniref:(apollo) hypothetical protein n=1 Tax=Parnassius apollo TaxID=110799 RepID=A0A8S3YCN7_PARAO|nr:unnamed protein product [Parnassius apollo]
MLRYVTEEDLDQLFKQQNVLATESIANNATTSKEQLTIEPNEDNTSTSAILTHELSAEPSVASEIESVVRVQEMICIVCGQESTGAHSCDICGNAVHAICGITTSEEGYRSGVLCLLCQKEENIKKQREDALQNLKYLLLK